MELTESLTLDKVLCLISFPEPDTFIKVENIESDEFKLDSVTEESDIPPTKLEKVLA
jgi:hypothetical protein